MSDIDGVRVVKDGSGGGVPIDRETAYVFEVRDGLITAGHSLFSRADAEEFARA
jgi:hypothetical protein